jgi:tetratricopeptide (TPR) repeat protein
MDPAEQLRILEGAKGHPGRLALATVDLAHGDLKEEERVALKMALKAAAVPHWVDEHILSALLSIEYAEALRLLVGLRNLQVVEPFPARGERAANVHEATRKALRKLVREDESELFQSLSTRAHQCFVGSTSFHGRIEELYHLFAADQEAAAIECARLDNEATTVAGPQTWVALAAMLSELLAEKWLRGRAFLEALLSVNECWLNRGETAGVEEAAQTALDLAKQLNNSRGAARAYALLGDLGVLQVHLELALKQFGEALSYYERFAFENPGNLDAQRELSVAHSRIGDVLFRQDRLDDALDAFRKYLAGAQAVVSKDPNVGGALREVGVAHSKIGSVFARLGQPDKAMTKFREHLTIAEQLVSEVPENTEWQRDLGVAHSQLGGLFLEQNQFENALSEFEQDLAIGRDLAAKDPRNLELQHDLVASLINIGITLIHLSRREEAKRILREAEALVKDTLATGVTIEHWSADLRNIQARLAVLIDPDAGPVRDGRLEH